MDSTRRHITGPFQTVSRIRTRFCWQEKKKADEEYVAVDPSCPQAVMQFQHGMVIMNDNLSLSFTPIAVDGRQLQSDPCSSSHATYTRYNQTELMAVSILCLGYSVRRKC
jgi:hypothetical protein